MWPAAHWLHSIPHVTLSLSRLPPDFSLSQPYLQSLLLIVMAMLMLGVSLLALLVLLLCGVISYTRPSEMAPVLIRLLALSLAIAAPCAAWHGVQANVQYEHGVGQLDVALDQLGLLINETREEALDLVRISEGVYQDSQLLKICLGCGGVGGVESQALCASLSGGTNAAAEEFAAQFTADALSGVSHVIDSSLGWHGWAARLSLGYSALLGFVVLWGIVGGFRPLLLGAHLALIALFWMKVAMVSVQSGLSVGFADACADPKQTIGRVLDEFAGGQQGEQLGGQQGGQQVGQAEKALEQASIVRSLLSSQPREMTAHQREISSREIFRHYELSCNATPKTPNPLSLPLRRWAGHLERLAANLSASEGDELPSCAPPLVRRLEGTAHLALANTTRAATLPLLVGCAGPVDDLFKRGVQEGLCGDAFSGVVESLSWEATSCASLFALALILPCLWHSRLLPPFHPPPLRRRAQQGRHQGAQDGAQHDAQHGGQRGGQRGGQHDGSMPLLYSTPQAGESVAAEVGGGASEEGGETGGTPL